VKSHFHASFWRTTSRKVMDDFSGLIWESKFKGFAI